MTVLPLYIMPYISWEMVPKGMQSKKIYIPKMPTLTGFKRSALVGLTNMDLVGGLVLLSSCMAIFVAVDVKNSCVVVRLSI